MQKSFSVRSPQVSASRQLSCPTLAAAENITTMLHTTPARYHHLAPLPPSPSQAMSASTARATNVMASCGKPYRSFFFFFKGNSLPMVPASSAAAPQAASLAPLYHKWDGRKALFSRRTQKREGLPSLFLMPPLPGRGIPAPIPPGPPRRCCAGRGCRRAR